MTTPNDLPGTTAGGVAYASTMQQPPSPQPGTGGQFAMLGQLGSHIQVDGAFAVGDNTSGS